MSAVTTEIYTLSLHDALPIFPAVPAAGGAAPAGAHRAAGHRRRVGQTAPHTLTNWGSGASDCWFSAAQRDRKSTRLNSSHTVISYAVFCLKKKKKVT